MQVHSRRTPADLFFSIDVIVTLLGAVLTTWLVNVVNASDASVAVHNLVAEGGAVIAAEVEEIVDSIVSGEEALGLTG